MKWQRFDKFFLTPAAFILAAIYGIYHWNYLWTHHNIEYQAIPEGAVVYSGIWAVILYFGLFGFGYIYSLIKIAKWLDKLAGERTR